MKLMASAAALAFAVSPLIVSDLVAQDKVVKTLDANTVKLEKSGKVSLAGIRTPVAPGAFPECFPW